MDSEHFHDCFNNTVDVVCTNARLGGLHFKYQVVIDAISLQFTKVCDINDTDLECFIFKFQFNQKESVDHP